MTSDEKLSAVPCKRIVNNSFSTSFGLHLAVITTDRKVLFFQRENTGKYINIIGLFNTPTLGYLIAELNTLDSK